MTCFDTQQSFGRALLYFRFSAIADGGDLPIRLAVQPAGMSAFNFFKLSLLKLNYKVVVRLPVTHEEQRSNSSAFNSLGLCRTLQYITALPQSKFHQR